MGPGLYFHVPFCVRKCGYCAFFSVAPTVEAVAGWCAGVERELEGVPAGFAPGSVFIGGGTPTVLDAGDLEWLLKRIVGRVDMSRVTEWTCEANPGTLTREKAEMLRGAGVTRLSLGAQSFCDATLKRLGRRHTVAETGEGVALARAVGFPNIGLDVIYGVPGVAFEEFQADVEAAMGLGPEHISCYCLEIEEGTPLAREAEAGRLEISEEEQRREFDWARTRLAEGGWGHYEISNFAKAGRECRQNQLYWSGGEYIGIGPAAHSHWEGVRWGNTKTLPAWEREFEERLDPEAKARETLVMGLRRLAGWRREEFRTATGYDYDALRGEEIKRLVRDGWLIEEPGRIRLAEGALFLSDRVFAELV